MRCFDEPQLNATKSFQITYNFFEDDMWDTNTIVVWTSDHPGARLHADKHAHRTLRHRYGKKYSILHIQEC